MIRAGTGKTYALAFAMRELGFKRVLFLVHRGQLARQTKKSYEYCHVDILTADTTNTLRRLTSYADRLNHQEFYKQVNDIIQVGLSRYLDKYDVNREVDNAFILYEKYSRRDVSLLMNCEKDLSSIMYGMKRIDDDVFVFVTYHKGSTEEKNYLEGKPDYADAFEDNMIFRWDSQIGRGVDSTYVNDVVNAKRKHLLVKKSDAESSFYYMGEFDVISVKAGNKKDNSGKTRDITKFEMKMHHPVRDDLLKYLQSNIEKEEVKVG